MTSTLEPNPPANDPPIPQAHVTRSRWPLPWIWLVPIVAIAGAGFYLYDMHRERGPQITIDFTDASGLKTDETKIAVLGVEVGDVVATRLAADKKHVSVTVRLRGDNADVAKEHTQFWIVRPSFSAGELSGLSTVLNGPYIEALPGDGKTAEHFQGLATPPIMIGDGVRIILHADRLQHLQQNAPVYFRGIQVGAVQDIRLNAIATGVNATLFIWRGYTKLVRPGSMFWSTSGADVKGGVFTGVELKLGDLKSLFAGGITFATPDDGSNEPAKDGTTFTLHDEPKEAWLKWSPSLPIEENH